MFDPAPTPVTLPAQQKRAKDLIDRWVEALESNRYQQCFGSRSRPALDTGIRQYCALGVLDHVYGKSIDDAACEEIRHILNLPSIRNAQYFLNRVILWNDGHRLSFPQIAQRLRANLRVDRPKHL